MGTGFRNGTGLGKPGYPGGQTSANWIAGFLRGIIFLNSALPDLRGEGEPANLVGDEGVLDDEDLQDVPRAAGQQRELRSV